MQPAMFASSLNVVMIAETAGRGKGGLGRRHGHAGYSPGRERRRLSCLLEYPFVPDRLSLK